MADGIRDDGIGGPGDGAPREAAEFDARCALAWQEYTEALAGELSRLAAGERSVLATDGARILVESHGDRLSARLLPGARVPQALGRRAARRGWRAAPGGRRFVGDPPDVATAAAWALQEVAGAVHPAFVTRVGPRRPHPAQTAADARPPRGRGALLAWLAATINDETLLRADLVDGDRLHIERGAACLVVAVDAAATTVTAARRLLAPGPDPAAEFDDVEDAALELAVLANALNSGPSLPRFIARGLALDAVVVLRAGDGLWPQLIGAVGDLFDIDADHLVPRLPTFEPTPGLARLLSEIAAGHSVDATTALRLCGTDSEPLRSHLEECLRYLRALPEEGPQPGLADDVGLAASLLQQAIALCEPPSFGRTA